jgi:phenylacetate-CoA ligase
MAHGESIGVDSRLGRPATPHPEHIEPEYERMNDESIRRLQLGLFKNELARVRTDNTFFRTFYEATGGIPGDMTSFDDVRAVPTVRKEHVLADARAHPPYGARLQISERDIIQVVESSGMSGLGREVQALSSGDVDLIRRAKVFQFYWAGARKGTVVALHNPVTMAAGALWSMDALRVIGANVLRLGGMEVEQRLDYMQRYGVEVMQASTSYIMRLEHAAEDLGLDIQRDFPRLRSIYVGSGGWTLKWAQELSERWNARLFEVYASSQRVFAYACEFGILRGGARGVLHFLPHLGLTEVIDRTTGEHVEDGQEGEVVITPFGMEASPLIRYATGDRARFVRAGDCPCGRRFDGIEAGSIGRYDDMLRIKEVNIWPETIDGLVFGHSEMTEYRGDLYVDAAGREVAKVLVEFRRRIDRDSRNRKLAALAQEIYEKVRLHFVVEEWSGPSLLQGTTGLRSDLKTKRWSDRRTQTRDSQSPALPARP